MFIHDISPYVGKQVKMSKYDMFTHLPPESFSSDVSIIVQGPLYKTFLLNIDQVPTDVHIIFSSWGDETSIEKIKRYLNDIGKQHYLNQMTIVISSSVSQSEYDANNIFNQMNIFNQIMSTINGVNNFRGQEKIAIKIRSDSALDKDAFTEFIEFCKTHEKFICTTTHIPNGTHWHRTFHPNDHFFGMSAENIRNTMFLALKKLCSRDPDIYCPPEQFIGKCFAYVNGIDIDKVNQYKVSSDIIKCMPLRYLKYSDKIEEISKNKEPVYVLCKKDYL